MFRQRLQRNSKRAKRKSAWGASNFTHRKEIAVVKFSAAYRSLFKTLHRQQSAKFCRNWRKSSSLKTKVQFPVKRKNSERCGTMTRSKNFYWWKSAGKVVILCAISGNQSNVTNHKQLPCRAFPPPLPPPVGKWRGNKFPGNLKTNMEITTY